MTWLHDMCKWCVFTELSRLASSAQRKCPSVWLIVSICFYLPVFPVPPWSSLSFFPSYAVHPFLIYYEYHNSHPWGALPRNYTLSPFALTQTCWSIYHTYQDASSTYDRVRCLLGWAGLQLIQNAHTCTQHRLPNIQMYLSTLWHSLSLTHTRACPTDATHLFFLVGFSSYWLSMAPLGAVEPDPV